MKLLLLLTPPSDSCFNLARTLAGKMSSSTDSMKTALNQSGFSLSHLSQFWSSQTATSARMDIHSLLLLEVMMDFSKSFLPVLNNRFAFPCAVSEEKKVQTYLRSIFNKKREKEIKKMVNKIPTLA